MANEDKAQVNTEMEVELIEKLDSMCAEDENNRSQMIRKLIRQEWARRHQMELPLETVVTNAQRDKKMQRPTAHVAVA